MSDPLGRIGEHAARAYPEQYTDEGDLFEFWERETRLEARRMTNDELRAALGSVTGQIEALEDQWIDTPFDQYSARKCRLIGRKQAYERELKRRDKP